MSGEDGNIERGILRVERSAAAAAEDRRGGREGKKRDLWIDTTWMEGETACTACFSVEDGVFFLVFGSFINGERAVGPAMQRTLRMLTPSLIVKVLRRPVAQTPTHPLISLSVYLLSPPQCGDMRR